MQTVFAWILVGLVIAAAYPLADYLLARSPRREDGRWLAVLLTLALAVGVLTQIMLWEGLLGIRYTLITVTVPYGAVMAAGWALWRRRTRQALSLRSLLPRTWTARLALLPLVLVAGAVLFNAVYWPFSKEDVLAIYHRYGSEMAQTGQLVPFAGRDEAFYQAYPIQIPLSYTYAYLASGWVNEYLARLIPALLSIGCIPLVYLLGRAIYGAPAGWAAAALLVMTDTFGRWASSGYVDLPMAFFYALAALFAYRLWHTRHPVDALLAGVLMGLAAWTKNAGLLGLVFLGAWLGWCWLNRRIGWRLSVLSLSAAVVIAAPWYIRNWLEVRLIVPPTAWTDQAQRTLESLLILVARPQNYGLAGWILLIGIGWAVLRVIRHPRTMPGQSLLLLWTLPFFGVWWLLVSYDPRFVLLFYPLWVVIGGGWLAAGWGRIPAQWQRRTHWMALTLALILAGLTAWNSVEFKNDILRHPFMNDGEKHALVTGLNRNHDSP
ncbi:MAG: glycosyltransferase family 39 protein [Anaerolineae bacterium]|nr:glycosyltransferase family 39 protein [Anaerolineae bacterium]